MVILVLRLTEPLISINQPRLTSKRRLWLQKTHLRKNFSRPDRRGPGAPRQRRTPSPRSSGSLAIRSSLTGLFYVSAVV
jgi:hypothetical protein